MIESNRSAVKRPRSARFRARRLTDPDHRCDPGITPRVIPHFEGSGRSTVSRLACSILLLQLVDGYAEPYEARYYLEASEDYFGKGH